MQQEQNNNSRQSVEERETYTFVREGGRWFIYLPDYLQQGWSKQDMELREGTHQILNLLSGGAKRVRLRLSLNPFDGANLLQLVEHCAAPRGGGIYLFNPQKKYNSFLFWICDLTLFVFGDVPEQMWVKRLPLRAKEDSKSRELAASQMQPGKSFAWFGKAA